MVEVVNAIPLGGAAIGATILGGASAFASATVYTLSASAGAFALDGQAASLIELKLLAGSFSLSGQDASLSKARFFSVSAGAFSLSGVDTAFARVTQIDPYWSQTVLLLHADDFTDAKKGTVTKIGSPTIDTAIKKFGTASISMPTADYNYLRLADSANWRFRTSPFTMEGWYRFTTYRDGATLISHWFYGFAWWFADGNKLYLRTNSGDSAKYPFVPNNEQWYHFAVDRDASNVLRIYIDGVMVSKTLNFTNDINGSSGYNLSIGTLLTTYSGYNFSGNYDEIRITKGVARYASDSGFALQTIPHGTGWLTAAGGSATLAGGEATFTRSNRMLLGRSATYYLFGRAANLSSAGYFAGSFALSGGDAGLIYRVPTYLSADAGAFAVSSADIYLRRGWVWKLRVNHFLLDGKNAVMQRPLREIAADPAELTITAQDAGMRHKWRLTLAGTSYAMTGYPSTYWRSRVLSAAAGAFGATLNPALLRTSWRTPVEAGHLVLEGQPISAYWRGRLRAAAGSYGYEGYLISLRQSHRLVADPTDYALTGLDANPVKGLTVFGQHGAFTLSGVVAKKQMLRRGAVVRYRLVGNGAIIWSGWGGDATGEVTSAVATASVSSGQAQGWVSAPSAQGAWSDQ